MHSTFTFVTRSALVCAVLIIIIYFTFAVTSLGPIFDDSFKVSATGRNNGVSILPSVNPNMTSNVDCCVDFGDNRGICLSIDTSVPPEKIVYNFSQQGYYNISIFCFKNDSVAESYKKKVYALDCFLQNSLFDEALKRNLTPLWTYITDPFQVTSTVQLQPICSNYSMAYFWNIYIGTTLYKNQTQFPNTSAFLSFVAEAMDPGIYKIKLKCILSFPDEIWIEDYMFLEFRLPNLKATVVTPELFIPYDTNSLFKFSLNGTGSGDPVVKLPSVISIPLTYIWTCKVYLGNNIDTVRSLVLNYAQNQNGSSQYLSDNCGFNISQTKIVELQNMLLSKTGMWYLFFLRVTRGTRNASVTQAVKAVIGNPVMVIITCIFNCGNKLRNDDLWLEMGVIGNDTMQSLIDQNAAFEWEIKKWLNYSNTFAPATGIVTETGNRNQGINIRKGSFEVGSKYLVIARLNVSNRTGSSIMEIKRNMPPYNGTCTINRNNDTDTLVQITFSCPGWLDDGENDVRSPETDVNPKLSYKIYQVVDGEEKLLLVTICPNGKTVLSVGDSARNYKTNVTIRVVDITGDYAENHFEVESRPFEGLSSVSSNSSNSNSSAIIAAIDSFTSKFNDLLIAFPNGSNPEVIFNLLMSGASQINIVQVGESDPIASLTDADSTEDVVKIMQSDNISAATSKVQKFMMTLANYIDTKVFPDSEEKKSSVISQVADTLSIIIDDPKKVNNETKETILGVLDRISNEVTKKSLDDGETRTAVNSSYKMIAKASHAMSPVEKRIAQKPNFDDLRLRKNILAELNGVQNDNDSSRSPEEELFLTYLQQLRVNYKLSQESSKLEGLQDIIKSTMQKITEKQPLPLGSAQSYGGSNFEQNISRVAASDVQGKSFQSMKSSVVIDTLDVPVRGDISTTLSSMTPNISVYKYDKDGESMFLTSDTCTFNFGTNFTGTISTKQKVLSPQLKTYNISVNPDDASGFLYHKFFIRSSKDYICVIVKPADNRTSQYQVYIKKTKNPTLIDYDVRIVTNKANRWGTCVPPGKMGVHEGLAYIGLKPDILQEYKALNRSKRELANITAADNYSSINPPSTVPVAYSFGITTSSCMVWSNEEECWIRNSCDMIWKPDEDAIICKCKATGAEMTFGNSFYVAPNAIDFSAVFLKFDALSQAAVMATLIIIFIGYIVLVIWSRRQDERDLLKWGVTQLEDNFPADNYFYLLRVYTGSRPGSGTRSRIGFVLSGDRMDTGVRDLYDGVRNQFSTGSVMNFLLSTSENLGKLEVLKIWHDNSGGRGHASWYLSKISVHDIQRKETFDFLVERWLGVEYGELDVTIPLCTADIKKKFKYRFFQNWKEGLSQDHTWISIFYRPQVSNFSRVQRVTCALTFLMLSMLTNAMYFNPNPNYESTTGITLGPFRFTSQQLYTSTVSSLITTSVMTVLLILFKKSRRRNKKRASTLKTKFSSSRYFKLPVLDKWFNLKRKESIELEKSVIVKGYPTFTGFHLPSWVLYIAWFLTVLSVLVSAFIVMLYSMQWGKQKSEEWLLSFILSFLESALLIDPIKVLCMSASISILFSLAKEGDLTLDRDTIMMMTRGVARSIPAIKREPTPFISSTELLQARKHRELELKVKGVLVDVGVNLFYLWILLSIGYCSRDDRSYKLCKTVSDRFLSMENKTLFQEITSVSQYFNWLRKTAFSNLFPVKQYNNASLFWRQKEFISGYSLYRLGPPRLRQVRTKQDACHIPYLGSDHCYLMYDLTKEETSSFCVGWKQKPCPSDEKIKKLSSDAWTFTNSQDIWGSPVSSQYSLYSGGGYISNMAVSRDITLWILNELWTESWIDRQTRAVMLEFTLYSADVNMFIYNIFAMEIPETGGVTPFYYIQPLRLYMHTGALGMYTLACEVIFLAFVVLNTVFLILKLNKQKKSYFREPWQVIDLLTLIGCYVAIVIYFVRFACAMKVIEIFKNDKKKFVNFQHIAVADHAVVLIIALLIFVATIRFLKIIGFSKRIRVFIKVFTHSEKDLIVCIVIFAICLLIYAAFGYLMFGSRLDIYSRFDKALTTLFLTMIGKNSYRDMNITDPVIAKIYFMLFVVVVLFFILTIFVATLEHSIDKVNEDLGKEESDDVVDALIRMLQDVVGLRGGNKTSPIKANKAYEVQPDASRKSTNSKPSVTTFNHGTDVQQVLVDIRQSFTGENCLAGRRQMQSERRKQVESPSSLFFAQTP